MIVGQPAARIKKDREGRGQTTFASNATATSATSFRSDLMPLPQSAQCVVMGDARPSRIFLVCSALQWDSAVPEKDENLSTFATGVCVLPSNSLPGGARQCGPNRGREKAS